MMVWMLHGPDPVLDRRNAFSLQFPYVSAGPARQLSGAVHLVLTYALRNRMAVASALNHSIAAVMSL
jgi:hypothetical protein